jgi:transcription initiation factor IIE alpha subunit
MAEEMEAVLEKLRTRERFEEENDFYRCGQCGLLVTFNQAMDVYFCCPDCGSSMAHFDTTSYFSRSTAGARSPPARA